MIFVCGCRHWMRKLLQILRWASHHVSVDHLCEHAERAFQHSQCVTWSDKKSYDSRSRDLPSNLLPDEEGGTMPSALLPRTPALSKICLHGSFWSWNHQISAQLFWELSKLTNLFEDRRSTPEDCEVGFCSLAQLFTSFSGCRLANSFGAYFVDTLGLPLSCRSNPVDFLVAAFSAGETQIWPGDLRVVAVFLVFVCFFSMVV